LHYAKKSYVVVPVKQSPGLRAKPDLIAVPVDPSTMRPLYSKAIAIEVESCNEVEVHPDQVAHNWVKESVKDFAEVHTWTWDRCFNKLQEVYSRFSADRSRVRIFAAKWPEHVKKGEEIEKSGEEEEAKEVQKAAERQVGHARPVPQGVVRRFRASDGFEYIAVFGDEGEAAKFDKRCAGQRSVVRVEGRAIRCVDKSSKASFVIEPLSLSRAS
jgi:hypothetical protein